MLAHLRESVHRAATIVRRLREMTMRGEVKRDSVSLGDCVREATALALTGSTVTVSYDVPAKMVVLADRIQLQQVLVNLVRNAIEAIGDRSDGRIDIAAKEEKGVVRLRVHDNGPGIPADVLPTIFDSFVSTKAQGMGVGLAISRTIIESHGGELTARSSPGEGATFDIVLPTA
ncbi:GHKL domain-containing protein [Sphingomonas parva]|uniref:histidine kinase n=1 Tax=Sphingomonas parva TaxID=2555898 RepID=A0A4Y8ZYC9_9SPHN|nr:ATP-binding protein [Sphingomonas parva]TFI59586.1 GHKL domain-containing protein [Sphingomonas parva]